MWEGMYKRDRKTDGGQTETYRADRQAESDRHRHRQAETDPNFNPLV